MSQHRWKLVSLALIGVIGIIAGAVYATSGSETEVRILGIRHDDGRVEVALQQANDDGTWGERIRPEYRVIPAGVTGAWLHSSPVSVHVAPAGDSMMEDSMPSDGGPAELYCVIHHGADDDPFWNNFNLVARQNALELGLTNVEISGEPDIAAHAAAIDDCVDRGALGIASSIPDIDGLRDSLIAARTSGAFLVTFNSGADVAGLVGSTVHYGLDDHAPRAELAGREFNEAGATGTVLCVHPRRSEHRPARTAATVSSPAATAARSNESATPGWQPDRPGRCRHARSAQAIGHKSGRQACWCSTPRLIQCRRSELSAQHLGGQAHGRLRSDAPTFSLVLRCTKDICCSPSTTARSSSRPRHVMLALEKRRFQPECARHVGADGSVRPPKRPQC